MTAFFPTLVEASVFVAQLSFWRRQLAGSCKKRFPGGAIWVLDFRAAFYESENPEAQSG
jgi:hypothetical protein